MSQILVTGGAGYIGSMLVPDLLSRGHKVTVVDNLMFKQTSLASSIRNNNLEFVVGDVRDESLMSGLIYKADVVIPLAAIVGAPACDSDPVAIKVMQAEQSLLALVTTKLQAAVALVQQVQQVLAQAQVVQVVMVLRQALLVHQ